MFDKDQKSIYVLAEKVMTGDPGRGGSDRHRLPPFASDIVGDKKITFRKDPDGLGAKTIIMYRTFGSSTESSIDSGMMTQFEEFVEKIAADSPEKWNEITQFLHYVYLSPGKFDKESREAAKNILDLYDSGQRPDVEEDAEHLH